jgi:aryl-alcohol dehydrogenase-like predicted oxidoreductase
VIADAHHATTTQVAIAWPLSHGKDILPIPGSKQIRSVEENMAAGDLELSEEELKKVRSLTDETEKHLGSHGRHPKAGMKLQQVDTPLLSSWRSQS